MKLLTAVSTKWRTSTGIKSKTDDQRGVDRCSDCQLVSAVVEDAILQYGFDLEDGPRTSVSAVTVPIVRLHADIYFGSYLNHRGVLASR